MKAKLGLIFIFLLLVFIGCGKKYHLERVTEYRPSFQPYSGSYDNTERQDSESSFSGNLNIKWRRKYSGVPIGPLSIGNSALIVNSTSGRSYFFDRQSGQYLGKLKTKTGAQTGLIVLDSLAYFALAPIKNELKCINLHNQKTLWSEVIKDVTGAPIIIGDRLYLASADGWVECRNRLAGNVIWKDSVGAKSPGGPSCYEGIVYFPLDDGKLIGYDEQTGKMLINVDLNQPLVSKAAVGKMIFVSGVAGILSALDRKTGKIVWERSFDWPIWASPTVDGDIVYVGDNGGILRALDIYDGHTLWNYQAEGVILAAPVIIGDYLIFASLDKNLYCLDKYTGLLNSRWKSDREIRFPAIGDGESVFVTTQDGSIYSFGD